MPRPRVSSDHLRAGLHHGREPFSLAESGPRPEAVVGARRIRARHRKLGAVCPKGAATTRSRVRFWRSGPGKRTGGPKTLARVAADSLATPSRLSRNVARQLQDLNQVR